MSKPPLKPISEALGEIRASVAAAGSEVVDLRAAPGRVLAQPVLAPFDQPANDRSAMDGYAVRAADLNNLPSGLRLVGEAAAGGRADFSVGPGEAARIFTGGVVPAGADTVVIQENTERVPGDGAAVKILKRAETGANIRRRGSDFSTGNKGISPGTVLSARDVLVAAAMNQASVCVSRRPLVALLATGDELVAPGAPPAANQTIASSLPALKAAVAHWGGEPIDLGIAKDRAQIITDAIQRGLEKKPDLLVTMGGASVGDHDLVHQALQNAGFELGFWRIAMKPGKPLLFGRLGALPVVGLPGNPISSMVCALLFVRAAIHQALGQQPDAGADELGLPRHIGMLGRDLPENSVRYDFVRAELAETGDGPPTIWPLNTQDSAQTLAFQKADCLVPRTPFSQGAKVGELHPIIPLKGLF